MRQAIENGLKVPDRVIVEYNSLSEDVVVQSKVEF